MNTDINRILRKVGLSMSIDSDSLLIKSVFNFSTPNIGTLLIFLSGLSFTGFCLSQIAEEGVYIYLLVLIGLAIIGFSIAVMLKQLTDFVHVNSKFIEYRNSLKYKKHELDKTLKIKIKKSKERIERSGTYSVYLVFELYLDDGKNENRILDFQVLDESTRVGFLATMNNTKEANILATELARMIKEKIVSSSAQQLS